MTLGEAPGKRLDKALSAVIPEEHGLSRSRLVVLIKDGHLRDETGGTLRDPSAGPSAGGIYHLTVPLSEESEVLPENLPLDVVYEDGDLIVINKPAGMVVHPAPGSPSGTLVNALLHHCDGSLSGVGGVKRPGIVHRIDKDTSGLLVVAKNDKAHGGLATQFADHSISRIYDAFVWGVPDARDPRLAGQNAVRFETGDVIKVTAPIGRHKTDRKKMAVAGSGGRHAVTRVKTEAKFGDWGAQVSCQLQTGRTHQIRVHLTHIGHPLIGDPVYGRARTIPARLPDAAKSVLGAFKRQALHARSLGFVHPMTGEHLAFSSELPSDMTALKHAIDR